MSSFYSESDSEYASSEFSSDEEEFEIGFEHESAVVCDNGTGYIKAGFATKDFPSVVSPSVVGRPRTIRRGQVKRVQQTISSDATYVIGEEALAKRDSHSLRYPIDHGIVTDWEDMERIWQQVFYNDLGIDPSEHPILLTEAPKNPKMNREKTMEIMFESFNFPAMFVSVQAVLSLYASGRTSGLVLDAGNWNLMTNLVSTVWLRRRSVTHGSNLRRLLPSTCSQKNRSGWERFDVHSCRAPHREVRVRRDGVMIT